MISFTGISTKQTAEGIAHKGSNRLHAVSVAALAIFTKVFDKVLASGTLFAASPLFLLIALAIKLNTKGGIFYSGTRLGKGKKEFTLYKFRTLPADFQQRNGARLVSSNDSLSPFFRFLRDSRLDELPQLWNVLRGDMNFVGPRPERLEVYEEKCQYIKNYDLRFEVRPGLIGYTQLFTPHGTPKRMRVLIDNRFIRKQRTQSFDPLCLYALPLLLKNALVRAYSTVRSIALARIYRQCNDERREERAGHKNASVFFVTESLGEKKKIWW